MSSSTPDPPLDLDLYKLLIEHLFAQNQFSIKLGLDRVRRALSALGPESRRPPCVLIAGTNGKGTVSCLLSRLLTAAGLRVGLYTSPHLVDLDERFRVDGRPVSRAAVLDVALPLMARFAGAVDLPDGLKAGLPLGIAAGWQAAGSPVADQGEALTFFELTTLMAVLLFERHHVDVCVMEVGLGGRLDATNALDPILSVITSVDLDHQQYLGDTVALIAAEKAAIMRPGRLAIASPQKHAAARSVIEAHAQATGAHLRWSSPLPDEDLPVWLRGAFADNAATAVAAFEACRAPEGYWPDGLREVDVMDVLASTRWPGRRDTLQIDAGIWAGPWLFDVAHNPAGMDSLADFLAGRGPSDVGVVGLMSDKDIEGVCARLARLPVRWITTRASTPRALPAEALASALRAAGADVAGSDESVRGALLEARAMTQQEVLVCGSVYLLGEVLEALEVSEGFFRLEV